MHPFNTVTFDNLEFIKNKKVKKIDFNSERLQLIFEDETRAKLFDAGQSCCEKRYLVCDDNLEYFEGGILYNIIVKEVHIKYPTPDNEIEIAFVDIITSKGVFIIEARNEHNGYYSGFDLFLTLEKDNTFENDFKNQ